MNLLEKIQYKLWFLRLPQVIKEMEWQRGAEIGVKAGRSYFRCLQYNPQLHMIGIDLWEDEPNSPYARNAHNGIVAAQKNKHFAARSTLVKGNAQQVATTIADNTLDFVFYDIYNFRVSSTTLHHSLIAAWIPKLKTRGYFIGRDFHNEDIAAAISRLNTGPVQPLLIGGKADIRLKYFTKTA